MSSTSPRRLIALPGAIERQAEGPATPDQALQRLLASHGQAPGLLSEARHREIVARNSAASAVLAARRARDAELEYELARRRSDPRGERRHRFLPATAAMVVLLLAWGAAGLILAWDLVWPDRVVLAIATAVLAAALAWIMSMPRLREEAAGGILLAGLVMCVALVLVRVFTTSGAIALRVAEAAALGIVLVAGVVIAILVLEHSEGWKCARLRMASDRAIGDRQASQAQVWRDEADAAVAMASWESLVEEECRLGHPGDAVDQTWIKQCRDLARQAATPM
jgi:hypothetical protein